MKNHERIKSNVEWELAINCLVQVMLPVADSDTLFFVRAQILFSPNLTLISRQFPVTHELEGDLHEAFFSMHIISFEKVQGSQLTERRTFRCVKKSHYVIGCELRSLRQYPSRWKKGFTERASESESTLKPRKLELMSKKRMKMLHSRLGFFSRLDFIHCCSSYLLEHFSFLCVFFFVSMSLP